MSWRAAVGLLHTSILTALTAVVILTDLLSGLRPGRGSIAYVSALQGNADIFLMDIDRGLVRQLTNDPGEDLRPAWSPDGRRLLFYSNRDGHWNLYVMRGSGLGVQALTWNEDRSGNPAWSPDGDWIAFDATLTGNLELYIMNSTCLDWTAGCTVSQLTTHSGPDEFPAWSPDGKRIVYQALRRDRREIYVMDVCKTEVCTHESRLLDIGYISHAGPVWSPDGTQIALAATSSARWGIYLIGADCDTLPGGCRADMRLLTDEGMDSFQPAWSPDGRMIVFQGWVDNNMELFVIDVDGRNLQRLTYNAVDDRLAAWWP